MSVKRRRHSPEFKFKVALEAAKEQQTISQLSSELSLHPTQISDWKKQLLENGKTVFLLLHGQGRSTEIARANQVLIRP